MSSYTLALVEIAQGPLEGVAVAPRSRRPGDRNDSQSKEKQTQVSHQLPLPLTAFQVPRFPQCSSSLNPTICSSRGYFRSYFICTV